MGIFGYNRVENNNSSQDSKIDNIVYYNDKPVLRLNMRMIVSKNFTQDQVDAIKAIYVARLNLEDKMRQCTDVATIRKYADEITELEFSLQDAWGFTRDKSLHRFWNLPKCSCPKMDNEDGYPFMSYMSGDCIVHGSAV